MQRVRRLESCFIRRLFLRAWELLGMELRFRWLSVAPRRESGSSRQRGIFHNRAATAFLSRERRRNFQLASRFSPRETGFSPYCVLARCLIHTVRFQSHLRGSDELWYGDVARPTEKSPVEAAAVLDVTAVKSLAESQNTRELDAGCIPLERQSS